jgi:DNA-binding transcriptional regulator YdaS (Cro superfamily)
MSTSLSSPRSVAAVTQAFDILGGPAGVARELGLSRWAVSKWVRHGVPVARVLDIERMTDGRVSRADLLPELFEGWCMEPVGERVGLSESISASDQL